jgi:endoglucanase Acf2
MQLCAIKTLTLLFSLFVASTHADVVNLGAGSYRTDLPPGADGKPRRAIEASPLVSNKVTGTIPTNDWWSSLVWPMHSPHSMAMFPHPLAVQAHADGLGIGYTSVPVVSDHLKDGKVFQTGTNYRHPFRQSLSVGLQDIETVSTVLDDFSDWAVTALWKKEDDELRATFAHGSPFVYFEKSSKHPIRIKFTAAKIDATREPVDPYVFEWKNITAKNTGTPAAIDLAINAGNIAGIASKARLVYDFDGDGKTDRTETFKLFATDPSETSWESYKADAADNTSGEMRHFKNGSIRFEFWKCFGKSPVQLKISDCKVTLPDGTTQTPGINGIATTGGDESKGAAKTFYDDDNVLGVTLNGSHFGIFAPKGTQLSIENDTLITDLAGKNYLSVAALPNPNKVTIKSFQKYAYAFLRDTKISYAYDPAAGKVTTTYTATTEPMEGANTDTVFALYRHQHLNCTEPARFSKFTYASPRGEMKVLTGSTFSTSIPFLGVLPSLPNSKPDSKQILANLESDLSNITFEKDDTYWNGKEFGKVTELIQIAEQLGKSDIRDQLLKQLKSRLEDWFDGNDKYFFYYDDRWDTLVGYPDSYGSAEQLNDHHFHYSYFIKAAATIAQFDPNWVKAENYGAMIDALMRDCASTERDDHLFPWMRSLDPYAGHSWAAGHAGFASGNNQESSSESMNFATSLILYGQATGRDDIRDLGIYWHSTEAEAIRHYWFDENGEVFPDGYAHTCVGMVWGDGASYGTWWTANPEEIHGINFLPINGGSLYLGRQPDYVLNNLKDLTASNRNFHNAGFPGDAEKLEMWPDVLAEYLALADPNTALSRLSDVKSSELGETKTHSHQWITALQQLGAYDPSIQSDSPTAVVFKKAYVIYNPTGAPLTVTFTDGKKLDAPSGLSTVSR